ncbi:MAG: hypothetical protein NT088_01935 [Candidatus Omnitrophica bacterium]|nr:hypothetical protein [Candidatus Omnitrophota bacterium]
MRNKLILLSGIAIFLSVLSLTYAASDQQDSSAAQPVPASQPVVVGREVAPSAQDAGVVASAVQSEPEILWVWGEVTAVDAVNKTLTLKYLDYETDQEKDINISVDDKTTYESVKSLDEIKIKNTLSVDYTAKDGINIAKNISLEKGEAAAGSAELGSEALPLPAPVSPGQQ